MKDSPITRLDIVALIEALTEQGLLKGQVGPVVEALAPTLRPPSRQGAGGGALAVRTRCITTPAPRDPRVMQHDLLR